jgi:hypothetical protein
MHYNAPTYSPTHSSTPTYSATPLPRSKFDRTTRTTLLSGRTASQTPRCNFCGSPDHFIRYCSDATEYIRLGRCKRNAEGKITLPSGLFVSRNVPGEFLKFRIDEWHRRHPGYLAPDAETIASRRTIHMSSPLHPKVSPVAEISNLRLPVAERIAAIESELKRLRNSASIAPIAPQYPSSPPHIAYRTADVPRRYLERANSMQRSDIRRATSDHLPPYSDTSIRFSASPHAATSCAMPPMSPTRSNQRCAAPIFVATCRTI